MATLAVALLATQGCADTEGVYIVEDENGEQVEVVEPECNDGVDNDRDGLYDGADPDCTSGYDVYEGPNPSYEDAQDWPACMDGVDNDGDGWVDGDDPECWSNLLMQDGTIEYDVYIEDDDCESVPSYQPWRENNDGCQ